MSNDPPDKAYPKDEELIKRGRKAFADDEKAAKQKREAEKNSLRVGEFAIKEVKLRLDGLKAASTSETEGELTTLGSPRPFV